MDKETPKEVVEAAEEVVVEVSKAPFRIANQELLSSTFLKKCIKFCGKENIWMCVSSAESVGVCGCKDYRKVPE